MKFVEKVYLATAFLYFQKIKNLQSYHKFNHIMISLYWNMGN